MTGKAYYLTTLGALKRYAARFTSSHWLAIPGVNEPIPAIVECATPETAAVPEIAQPATPLPDTTTIFALIEADEGAHLALEDDAEFQALPHPLAQRPISPAAQEALAPYGVTPGATAFDAAEAVGQVHPLLRHRVF